MEAITIIKSGTKIKPALAAIEMIITAASIRNGAVTYEASYFNDGEYKTVWLSEMEFEIIENKGSQKIGFK